MDEQTRVINLCRIGEFERAFDNYHRICDACKNCASIRCDKHYQRNREKKLEKSNLIRQNNKTKLQENRKTINSYKEDIQKLYEKIDKMTEKRNMRLLIVLFYNIYIE